MSSVIERRTRIAERPIVAITNTFCALLLLRNASPPPPKTGESPDPGACKRIAATRRTATTIWNIDNAIGGLYHFTKHLHNVFYNHPELVSKCFLQLPQQVWRRRGRVGSLYLLGLLQLA